MNINSLCARNISIVSMNMLYTANYNWTCELYILLIAVNWGKLQLFIE